MNQGAERHRRLRTVFDEALLRDASARDAYLHDACADDPELLPQVMRLLAAHGAVGSFLEHPVGLPAPPVPPHHDFPGTERFTVLRRLGVGGMGAVYEVQDRARDEIVALKTWLRATAADTYRLKREFRSLAGVAHPNLVCLYELHVEDDQCFFTMELVNGVSFVDYVRTGSAGLGGSNERLYAAFRQLVSGVSELHRVGKLHRDIKPSNVLVTPGGRVVILDFGLITELWPKNPSDAERTVGGTPAYMSPEEGLDAAPSEASDWYSVGVTLYETLTGEVPFAGPFLDVLLRKQAFDPPPPADIAPDVPRDLNVICMGLLCRDPGRRMSGREALRELEGGSSGAPGTRTRPVATRAAPFVGRDRELNALNEAFRAAMHGETTAVSVCGPSGIGKSALVRRFLDGCQMRADVVVLSGCCYEHESVPYKALDGVVDSLSRYLSSLPLPEVDALLPSDLSALSALSRLFPAMLQIEAVAGRHREREPAISDPLALRRRAFAGLRTLLARIAERRPLVIYIDDLQWADADSAVLLEELRRPPDAPALLTVVCFRSEEIAGKPFLRTLLERSGRDAWSALALGPMTEDESSDMIRSLLPREAPLSPDDRLRITREAAGSPFFLEQLAHYVAIHAMGSGPDPTFAEMLEERLRELPAGARPFLETLAVCGRPMDPAIVGEASGLPRDARPLLASLRSAHFIRSSGSSERIEPYHDRIREALAGRIPPEDARLIHSRLAETLVANRCDDAEALFEHYRGSGDSERASRQADRAAEKSNRALAFDRAALFYRHALELSPASPAALEWKGQLARALANAGRPREAADVYLEAAAGAGGSERVEFERLAAEQFLIGGHIDRGLDVIGRVLAAVGMRLPKGPRTALASLLWRRARLRWRGLNFVQRDTDQIAAETLLRIDTCWSVMTGLGLVDMIRASDFSARHLLLALDAGEPSRIARALAVEAAMSGAAGTKNRPWAAALAERSRDISEALHDDRAIALSTLSAGMMALQIGQWKKSSTLCRQALEILRDRCVGVTWELNSAQNFLLGALLYQGELSEVSRLLPALLAGAESCGNLSFETELRTRMNLVWLAADDPDEGERQAIDSIERWSHMGFHRQHYSGMLARVQTELYRGNGAAAWHLTTRQWPAFRRTLLLHIQFFRIEASYLRARSALAAAAGEKDSRRLLSVAREEARRLAAEEMPWSDAFARLVGAGLAHIDGDRPLAIEQLAAAADGFDREGMGLYAAVARRRLGTLKLDASGQEMRRQAEEWMAAQHIRNPAAITRMLAPGFTDLS